MTGAVEERRGQWVSEVHTPELLRNLRKDVKQGVSCILERHLRLPCGRRTAEADAAVTEREEGGLEGLVAMGCGDAVGFEILGRWMLQASGIAVRVWRGREGRSPGGLQDPLFMRQTATTEEAEERRGGHSGFSMERVEFKTSTVYS